MTDQIVRNRFDRLNELFDDARALPPPEREAFLAQRCADEPELAQEVLELIAADAEVGDSFLSLGGVAGLFDLDAVDATPPETIGPYEVVREIGRGGMGVVYEALQTDPRRRVAVKVVVRHALLDADLKKRFAREASVLGQLAHPGIAHVYEAGSALVNGERWPYFAMEYIEGRPVDRYLDGIEATTNQRVELFARICDAVQHAHERGVVHRDLKPSNILVVEATNGPAQPKILDFGIARVTDGDQNAATTLRTGTGHIVGTVGYMSPEQLAADRVIDARSDVYALGVVLFRLIAGRLPFDLHDKPLAEVARVVRDEDPTRLSHVDRRWRGDLDTIISKALEKDPAQRYASAAALAADLRRYLADEPIVARPPSTWYRTAKFARRNKGLVGGIVGTMVALVVGLVVATAALVEATQERRSAEAVTDFLAEMMAAARPERGGKDVSLRAVLEDASSKVQSGFADQPTVRARLEFTLARTYASLGDYEQAEQNVELAIALWSEHIGAGDERTIRARSLHAEILYFLGKREAAAEEFASAYAGAKEALGPDHPLALSTLGSTGFMHMQTGRYEEAEAAYQEALAGWNRVDPDNREALDLRSNYAVMLTRQLRFDEAEPIYADIIDRYRRVHGPEHPETLLAIANLAAQYNRTDRAAEAIPLLRDVLAAQRRVVGETHSKTLITQNNLAVAHSKVGEWEEGERLLRAGLDTSKTTYGPEAPSTLMFTHSLGRLLRQRGDLAAAEPILLASLALHEKVYGDTGEARLNAMAEVVKLRLDESRFSDAVALAERLDEASAHSSKRCAFRALLARSQIGLSRYDEAEATLASCSDDKGAAKDIREARDALAAAERSGGAEAGVSTP